jgi:hypothetical protein
MHFEVKADDLLRMHPGMERLHEQQGDGDTAKQRTHQEAGPPREQRHMERLGMSTV